MTTDGRLHIRFSAADREKLDAIMEELEHDDVSSTVRFLVREKYRELATAAATAPAKRKRRSTPG